jgi:hypothetical protein
LETRNFVEPFGEKAVVRSMLPERHEKDLDRLSYLMRQTLMEALAAGPPYQVHADHVHAASETQLLTEMEGRGLITSGPVPVLTEEGVAEAKWFARYQKE